MSRLICFSLVSMIIGRTTLATTTTEFECADDVCRCESGDCVHTCTSHQCANAYFVCSSDANSCLIYCDGDESCKAAQVYSNADTINVNCNGAHSCDELQVFCGASTSAVQIPTALSTTYSVDSQATTSISDCFVNVLSSNAMRGGKMQCDGSIANCVMNAYADNAINDTLFNCTIETPSVSGHGCEINCIPSTNCDAVDFVCASELCSCGVNDRACASPSIHFSTQPPTVTPTPPPVDHVQASYNCIDLEHTELEIKSIVDSDRDSSFQYEICGKDALDQSITFRYQNDETGVLSADTFTIHQSESYAFQESDGETYRLEWTHTEPKHLCWRSDELNAIKIDLYYNRNISFAFTLIYHETEVTSADNNNDRHGLVPRNNYNLAHPVSYLYFGFIYFHYEYDVLRHTPVTVTPTSAPTVSPTVPPLHISQVNSTDNNQGENENGNGNGNGNGNTEEDPSDRVIATPPPTSSTTTTTSPSRYNEQQVQNEHSTTLSVQNENANKNEIVSAQNNGADNTLKYVLFAVAGVLFAAMVFCIVFLVLRNRRKHNAEGMQGAYATADDMDTDDDEAFGGDDNDIHLNGNGQGNGIHLNFNKLRFNRKGHASEADVDEDDDAAMMGRNGGGGGANGAGGGGSSVHHLLSDDGNIQVQVANDNVEDRRIGSGIIDEADLMEQNEYDRLKRDANMNAADKRQSESQTQTSQSMRKYRKLNPQQIMSSRVGSMAMAGGESAQTAVAATEAEHGVGYVAHTQRVRNGGSDVDDDDTESLNVRERDVSMDAEYHHIVADPDPKTAMSVLDDDDEDLDEQHNVEHDRRASLSLTENEVSARRDLHDTQQPNNMYDTMLIHKSISSMDDDALRDGILQEKQVSPPPADTAMTTMKSQRRKVPSTSVVTVTRHNNDHRSNTTLGFEPGSVLDHYVNQDSTFQTLQRMQNDESPKSERMISPSQKSKKEPKEKERRHSISRSISQSMSIPPITFNEDIVNVKTLKTKTTVQTAAVSMKMFSKKIQDCAVKFGHGNALTTTKKKTNSNEMAATAAAAAAAAAEVPASTTTTIKRNPKPKKQKEPVIQTPSVIKPSLSNAMDADDREIGGNNGHEDDYATMVIYKNVQQTSLIPSLQAKKRKQAAAAGAAPSSKNVPFDGVNTQFLEPASTQTMIVKRDAPSQIDAQLTQLHQKASRGPLLSDDTSTEEEEEEDARDPIDASEEEEAVHPKRNRHRHNKSSVSSRSSHQRTMIINDDLDIDHIMHSIEDDE